MIPEDGHHHAPRAEEPGTPAPRTGPSGLCPACGGEGGLHAFGCPEAEAPRKYYGVEDIDALFGGASEAVIPFRQAPFAKGYDTGRVRETVSYHPRAIDFAWFDPRELLATQPGLQRPALVHYLGQAWDLWGMPFEPISPANRIPLIYSYKHPVTEAVQHMVLVGHHRSAAALLRGEELMARQVFGPVWLRGQRP